MGFELAFLALLFSSLLLPVAIYAFMWQKRAISPLTVLLLALTLIGLSGLDLLLLQHLATLARHSPSLSDDWLWASEMRLAVYLLPATFAGLGINLLSHVLIRHLERAERRFEHVPH